MNLMKEVLKRLLSVLILKIALAKFNLEHKKEFSEKTQGINFKILFKKRIC